MINLSQLIEEIQSDNEVLQLSANEQIQYITFRYLAEVTNIDDIYSYKTTSGFSSEFVDVNGIKHFIRILFQPLKIPRHDVKFGFYDEVGKPSYEKPNLHFNLHPDEKIFNTHIHILLKQFLERDGFFEKTKAKELYLPAIDYARFRLFRITLNKFLDKSKYEFFDHPKSPNTIIVKKKDSTKTESVMMETQSTLASIFCRE